MDKLKEVIQESLFDGLNKISVELGADDFFDLSAFVYECIKEKLSLNDVSEQRKLLKAFDDWCLNNERELSSLQEVYIGKFLKSITKNINK